MAIRKCNLHSFVSALLVVSLLLVGTSYQAETRVEQRVDTEKRVAREQTSSIRREIGGSDGGERRFRREERQREERREERREGRMDERRERVSERRVARDLLGRDARGARRDERRQVEMRQIRLAPQKEMENHENRVDKVAEKYENSAWELSMSLLLGVVGYTLMTPASAKLYN